MTTNVSMTSLILNALGLMTRVEHERLCDERFESLEGMIDSRNETIETITADRDNWRAIARDRLLMVNNLSAGAEEWQAKFKLAATDLAKQAEEIADLREAAHREGVRFNELASDRDNWRQECLDLRPDALLWRNARDKRAKRGGGK